MSGILSPEALLPLDGESPFLHLGNGLLSPMSFSALHTKHSREQPESPLEPLIPRSQPPAPDTPQSTDLPAFMQTSLKTQEDLSEQLALMAAQLKRNAQSFAAQLHEDNALVQLAHDQLEGVHTRVSTERVTLRNFRSKSGYTTCMALGIIVVVVVAWVMMFFMIKVT